MRPSLKNEKEVDHWTQACTSMYSNNVHRHTHTRTHKNHAHAMVRTLARIKFQHMHACMNADYYLHVASDLLRSHTYVLRTYVFFSVQTIYSWGWVVINFSLSSAAWVFTLSFEINFIFWVFIFRFILVRGLYFSFSRGPPVRWSAFL